MAKNGANIRILLLEDDPLISDIVCEFLEERLYNVTCVCDGHEALDKAYENLFDLFIFDVKVPHLNGFDLLKKLREFNQETPAIFITSLASIDDMTAGYNCGCDDYIRKPFELKELELRVKHLLKTSLHFSEGDRIILNQEWSYEPGNAKLIGKHQELFLTKKEAGILKVLLAHKGKMIASERIIASVWGYEEDATDENLRTHIKKLRKVLGKDMIQNIRKQGYMLAVS